jgi:hypothetical protein
LQARAIDDGDDVAQLVADLALYLPNDKRAQIVSEAFAVAHEINNSYTRALAVAALAPQLPNEIHSDAVAAARKIEHLYPRARALAAITPHLSAKNRTEVMSEAISGARAIDHAPSRIEVFAALAPVLSPTLLSEALVTVRKIKRSEECASALEALAPYLTDELLSEALGVAREIEDTYQRTRALIAIASSLSADKGVALWFEALVTAHDVVNRERSLVLKALAPHLSHDLLIEALGAARTIEDKYQRALALTDIASNLPTDEGAEVLSQLIDTAHEIANDVVRTKVLFTIAPHLSKAKGATISTEALAATRNLVRRDDILSTLSSIDYDLSLDLYYEALEILLRVSPKARRRDVLRIIKTICLSNVGQKRPRLLAEIGRAIVDVGRWFP